MGSVDHRRSRAAGGGCWRRRLVVAASLGGLGGGLQANNRGVAVTDGFHYIEAIPKFEQVVRLAPDWLPGRINLGIALLNAGSERSRPSLPLRPPSRRSCRRNPDNPYAHFCLGILLLYKKDGQEAAKHFEAVLKKDPGDAYSWYWLGTLKTPASDEQTECYEKALKLNRHLSGAMYGLAMNLRRNDPKAAERFWRNMKR